MLKAAMSIFGLCTAALFTTSSATSAELLPEGNNGIAANYPGDAGIGADPKVVFADDFESYASAAGLLNHWSEAYHEVRIATEPGNVFSGQKSVELTIPITSSEFSNTIAKELSAEQDVLFMRYYSKFDPTFDVLGSSHNGGIINAHFYVNGQSTAGVPANGYNKFLVSYENWRDDAATANPGRLNVYVYHPEQRSQWGDHWFPTGLVLPFGGDPTLSFGADFVSRPDVIPELGRWYCYEVMVKANTPGIRDGRVAFWLDGKLIADFRNLRLRDIDTLKMSRFSLEFHARANTASVAHKWYDNVVVATSYIGPLVGQPVRPRPPTDVQVVR
jgi:hypothetical protein